MLTRVITSGALACALLACAEPASAQQQTLNFTIGYFAVRTEGACDTPRGPCVPNRGADDVLEANRNFLTFDVSDFNGPTFGAEWLIPFGQYLEGGIGAGVSRRTVPSVYTDFVDSDGSEIEQELRLQIVPVAFTVRLIPFGQSNPVQPYVGGGLGLFQWSYREQGEFVDFDANREIFEDTFTTSGSATGPIVLGGIRFAGNKIVAGGEVRYQTAEGDIDDTGFAGSTIDLTGWSYNFTVGYRF